MALLAAVACSLILALGLALAACTGGDDGSDQGQVEGSGAGSTADGRSSGQVTEPDGTSSDGTGDDGGGGPETTAAVGSDQDQGQENGDGGGTSVDGAGDGPSYQPEPRPDGIEFVFADGALGPAELGATIEDITAALGPAYEVTAEESIRVDFPSGYSVSRDDEVLFWAIEEDGVITVLMSSNPKVGLDGGLRPKLTLDEAVTAHGEPTFTFGPEGREFASFEDGVGSEATLSVLVAIGEFGGPVGIYDGGPALGAGTLAYQPENANIKELWFWAS